MMFLHVKVSACITVCELFYVSLKQLRKIWNLCMSNFTTSRQMLTSHFSIRFLLCVL